MEYGLTKNRTIIGEVPFHIEHGNYNWGGFRLKQKYRLYPYFEIGLSRQISTISTVNFTAKPENSSKDPFSMEMTLHKPGDLCQKQCKKLPD